ncbi:MAG: hypothetical protein J6U56_06110 [Spirochaetia bacterium]|nr:hypothetical protein [Spirochaetia bacterium]
MAKTNSNSITSILVSELNKDITFRKNFISLINKKKKIIDKKTTEKLEFFDCTHSPLRYKEMKNAEIDIIARFHGEHKPKLMIEIKANQRENLQDSQKREKEYHKTSTIHGIPLIFIIPDSYYKKTELQDWATIITWEEIREKSDFKDQIDAFVEINIKSISFSSKDNKKIDEVLNSIKDVLTKSKRQNISCQKDQWGIGFYYSTLRPQNDYFIGFIPKYREDKKFFSLCIAEKCNNNELGDRDSNPKVKPLFFDDGWYYFSVKKDELFDGDKALIDKKVLEIIKDRVSDEDITDIQDIYNRY